MIWASRWPSSPWFGVCRGQHGGKGAQCCVANQGEKQKHRHRTSTNRMLLCLQKEFPHSTSVSSFYLPYTLLVADLPGLWLRTSFSCYASTLIPTYETKYYFLFETRLLFSLHKSAKQRTYSTTTLPSGRLTCTLSMLRVKFSNFSTQF